MCLTTLSAQHRHPLYFYSKGILKEVIYLSAGSEISFYEENTPEGVQPFQKIKSHRGVLTYPLYEHDSLTFVPPSAAALMRHGEVNLLTAALFSQLVYDYPAHKVSSYVQEGLPAVVFFWKERDQRLSTMLENMAQCYRDRLLFYSVYLEEERYLEQFLPQATSPQLCAFNHSGPMSRYQSEWSEENLTTYLDGILSKQTPNSELNVCFAEGVTLEQGWWDVEKRGVPEDFMACWLITSSNMLQWWQDQYTAMGMKLPEGTPNGPGTGSYQMAILDQAMQSFNDLEKGGSIHTGLLWYIEGKSTDISGQSYPKSNTGGYLKTVSKDYLNYSTRPFIVYDHWEKASTEAAALSIFSEQILAAFQRGDVIGMDIKTHVGLGGALHAITIWGAAYDANGQVRGIYMTDSDDHIHQLVYCEVKSLADPFFNTKVIAINVPQNEAYPNGGEWEVLKAYNLSVHSK